MNDIDILKLFYTNQEFEDAIKQYKQGRPAAYIIGEWEFFGDRYFVNENCLIPRCDTERVVEKVLEHLNDGDKFADLCTGSGCIAISTLKRKKNSYGVAVDISKKAIELAKRNAELNSVENRLEFICADIFTCPLGNKKYDVIVSNPPYIPTNALDTLDEYVKKEPQIALDGGNDGMDFYNFLASTCKNNLTDKGKLIFEIGYDQEEKIKLTAEKNGFNCKVTKDYSGNPRVAVLQKIKSSEET